MYVLKYSIKCHVKMYTGWACEELTWCSLKYPSQSQVSEKYIKAKGLGSCVHTCQLEEMLKSQVRVVRYNMLYMRCTIAICKYCKWYCI